MQVIGWDQADLAVALTSVYLRLNGYFVTGYIVHSARKGSNKTEIDCLAVRHCYHYQSDREVESDSFLKIPSGKASDLIICEVKSDGIVGNFNNALKDVEAMTKVIRWAGFSSNEATINSAASALVGLLDSTVARDSAEKGIELENNSIRALLSCPAVKEEPDDQWCLTEKTIFDYAHKCYVAAKPRCNCSTKYDYGLWGPLYKPLVLYFKDKRRKNKSFDDLLSIL